MGGTLFFSANDGTNGVELWKSDGTAAGTVLVKNINSYSDSNPENLTNVNGTLFFTVKDGAAYGRELWKSDGTAAGTVLVKDIRAGTNDSDASHITNVNGTLFFSANDGTNGVELWKSDGTAAGTVIVKDIYAGSNGGNPSELTNVNDTLFFRANDGTNGIELWKSDGTEAGTVLVKDIYVGSNGSAPAYSYLTNVDGALFFVANDGTHGMELWKSDGTQEGTVMVKDIYAGSNGGSAAYITNVDGTLFFMARDTTNGNELWKSDGTEAGTVRVKDIYAGWSESNPTSLANVNGTLYFRADDGAHGIELWKSDGTEVGTVLVKDIYTGTLRSLPESLTNVNGTLYFRADDGAHGIELWKSDGTAAGTVMVKDIYAGSTGSNLLYLTNVNGTLFFSAYDAANGVELWKSDGTELGTVLVKDIAAGSPNNSDPWRLTDVNGTLFFAAHDPTHGYELWKSDGTEAGTVLVKDIYSGWNPSAPDKLTNVNGTLYFWADDGTNGVELWKSDGTQEGTVLVKDIYTGSGSSWVACLTNVDGTLFFTAIDGTHGRELWKSDGTQEGTVMVKDIYTGSTDGFDLGAPLTKVDGTLFFTAIDGTHGRELWKSDGTESGTVLVKDIYTGSTGSHPELLTNLDETLFFTAYDPSNGSALWKSDGTAVGTVPVKKFYGGTQCMTNVDGTLFFANNDTTHGMELWKSDGTEGGTVLVKDIFPGSIDSDPYSLTNVNGTLFFKATDGTHGIELWKAEIGLNEAPANTVPVGLLTTYENIDLQFRAAASNEISVSDADAGSAQLQVQLDSTNGTMTLFQTTGLAFLTGDGTDDSSMQFTGTIVDINAALDGMRFRPTTGFLGFAEITLNTNDLGNSGSDGPKTDTDTVHVQVMPNYAPSMEAAIPDQAVNEDAPDTILSLYPYFQDTEDTDAQLTYTVADNTNPALFASVDISDPANFRLDYSPDANGTADITIRATDTGGLWVEDTFTVTVSSVNDAPAGADKTVTMLEDGIYTITAADFGFTDTLDSPANDFASVKITQLETAGSLKLNGADVTLDQVIARTDIDVGLLTFEPAADANGTGYATFQFAVIDNGGTSGGGVDTDQSPNAFTFDVTPVPIANSQSVTVNEDGTLAITVTGSDPYDPDVSMVSFEVTSSVTHGTLSAIGSVIKVSAGLYSQQFLYTPTSDYNGADSFQFTIKTPTNIQWSGFGAGTDIGTDTDSTISIALGDVDADGDLDVIAGNHSHINKVYLGDGTGGFSSGTAIGTDIDTTTSVVLGDVDGDGDLDVVVGDMSLANKVYLGDGSGGFSSGTAIGTETDHTYSVALGDVNGDGNLDVVTGNWGETNKVYLGDGDGTFGSGTAIGTETDHTYSVALGDVNGDGNLDVMVGNMASETNKVYLGDGDGTFGTGTAIGTDTDQTVSVALGDVDGDGDLDVIAGNMASETNKVYLGDGDGTFGTGTAIGTDTDQTVSVALGDVDGDGDLDVIAGNSGLPTLVYLGDGSGGFSSGVTISAIVRSVALGDVDGDNDLDVVTSNWGETTKFYINNGLTYDQEASTSATVSITVNPVNDVPVLEGGGLPPVTVNEDAPPTVINLASYYEDVEDGNNLTYSVAGNTNPGLFSDIVIDNIAHTLTLSYAANQNGAADLTIQAIDNGDGSSPALILDQTFTVTVNPVNDAPVLTVSSGGGEPGSLDTTFDFDGKVTTSIGSGDDIVRSVAIQADGKIVVAGYSIIGSNIDFAVARYSSDGNLDTSFGEGDGIVTTDFAGGDDYGMSVAVQPDGKIVLAGYAYNGSNNDFALVRYDGDGTLDTTFGTAGKVTTPVGSSDDKALSVAFQDDGRIVAAGIADGAFALIRYNGDGSPDTSFGGGGWVTTDFGGYDDYVMSVAIQPDHKIVAGGVAHYDFALARYNTDGSLDTSFGSGGSTTILNGTDGGAPSVAIQPDGKILELGYQIVGTYDFALARYSPGGNLDTTFGSGGMVTTDFYGGSDVGYSVALQPDGRIVSVGYVHNGSNLDFGVALYNPDGTLDLTFDTDGKLNTPIGSSDDVGLAVAIQPDGKVVAAGYTNNGSNNDFAVVRYNSGGGGLAYTENDGPQVIDGFVTITDVDNTDMVSATVQISGNYRAAEDVLTFTNTPNITGTWDADSGVLTLSGTDTVTNYQAALRSLTYENTSESPDTATRTVTWTVNDGIDNSAPETTEITVTAVNDPPVAADDGVYGVNEDGPVLVVPADGVLANDTDLDNPHTLTAQLVDGPEKGSLALNGDGSFTYDPSSAFEYLAVGATENVTFTYKTIDGQLAESGIATVTIQVTGQNDAPVAQSDTYAVDEDGVLTVPTAGVLGNDTDVDLDTLTAVQVSGPTHGTLAFNSDGSFVYTPFTNYNGNDSFTYMANDGLADSNVATVDIMVNAVNDAPVNTVPIAAQQTDAAGAVIFSSANGNLIFVSDVDTGTAELKVTLTATHGTLTLNGVTGLTFDPGQDGTADATMTFTGTVANINNALNGMSFNHEAGYYGMAHVTVAVDDQGNTGSGGPQTANGAVDLSVEPYDTWFAGFETEAGWDVFNSVAGACSYYTHDYTLYWQQMNAGGAWSFYNGTAWVSTNALGTLRTTASMGLPMNGSRPPPERTAVMTCILVPPGLRRTSRMITQLREPPTGN